MWGGRYPPHTRVRFLVPPVVFHMKDRYAYLTEFENLLGSFQTNPDSDIQGCLRRYFTTPDNLARFMGFCQAIFRLDADKYHRDFAVEVMAATGLALSDLARDQAVAWYRDGGLWPRPHTSGCSTAADTEPPPAFEGVPF